tara:strand:+ start:3359 stop:3949 length:591 start_codon:yes stop_codon:yes gene_type:complete
MFNGIIFNKGRIKKIKKRSRGINLFVESKIKLSVNDIGVSISCDGVCLTLISLKKNVLEFYLSNETLEKSKFSKIKIGHQINLELPLKYGQKISGHICQGHVDTVGKVISITKVDKSRVFKIKIFKSFKKYIVQKGSILINGISLTISKIGINFFEVWIIPHTFNLTNLSVTKKNDLVNIEFDILGKYIKNFIHEK